MTPQVWLTLATMAVFIPAYALQLLPLLPAYGLSGARATVVATTVATLPLLLVVTFPRFAGRRLAGDRTAKPPGHLVRALSVLPVPLLVAATLNARFGVGDTATILIGALGELAGWACLTRAIRIAVVRVTEAAETAKPPDPSAPGQLIERTAVHVGPREASEGHGRRLASAGVAFVIGSVMLHGYLKPMLRDLEVHGIANIVASSFVLLLALMPWAFVFRSTYTVDFSSARLRGPVVLATWCAASTLWIALQVSDSALRALDVWAPVTVFGAATVVFGSTAAVWLAVFRHVRGSGRIHRHRLVRLGQVADADELIAACRSDLASPSLSEDERSVAELNLVAALITLSRRADHDDALLEAHELLDRARRSSPRWTFLAAGQLVEAMHAKAERSGDLEGYEHALQLLVDAAVDATAQLPDAPAKAMAMRSQCRVQLSERAASDGDQPRARRLHEDAVSDLRRAVELAPTRRLHAEYTVELARVAGPHPLHRDLDASIASCRRALRRLWLSGWSVRAQGYLALADLLALRAAVAPAGGVQGRLRARSSNVGRVAALVPSRGSTDRLRALWLCVQLVLAMESGAQARERIPALWRLPRIEPGTPAPSLATRRVVGLYRKTFENQALSAPGSATELAARWASDAARRRDVHEAAEAHWCWIRAVVADAHRRVVAIDKQRRLQRVQGSAAEACYWLVRAGRARDAAVALKLGRAVLLTERMQRANSDLPQQLVAAGRPDIRERWLRSSDRITRADRAVFAARSAAAGDEPSGDATAVAGGFASEEYLALCEHERLLQEIGRLPGCEEVDASLDFDGLRDAASTGPIVYLSASERGGCAIIVTASPEPQVVDLPALRAADVGRHAQQLSDGEDLYDVAEELADVLPWLWQAAMSAVASAVEPQSLVTLIPTGALAMLPLHAAGEAPAVDGTWCDRTDGLVFRYAPNARVLLRAQRTAADLADEQHTVLTVAVPDAPDKDHLPCATRESDGVCAQLGAHRVVRPSPATAARVLVELDSCAIWHFACHGEHDPEEPLDSRLLLEDGALTLGAILARPSGRGRLAVLSACHTAVLDAALLDEVIGFPSAMLQAGVAGVVASGIAVADSAAMLIVVCLFERLAAGAAPPNALADAQTWLRSATNAQIHERFPRLYPLPEDRSCHDEAYWARRDFADPFAWAMFSYWGA